MLTLVEDTSSFCTGSDNMARGHFERGVWIPQGYIYHNGKLQKLPEPDRREPNQVIPSFIQYVNRHMCEMNSQGINPDMLVINPLDWRLMSHLQRWVSMSPLHRHSGIVQGASFMGLGVTQSEIGTSPGHAYLTARNLIRVTSERHVIADSQLCYLTAMLVNISIPKELRE